MTVPKLLNFPHNSYLMVRLDYVVICGDELEAKVLRIVEMYTEMARSQSYQEQVNVGTSEEEITISDTIWIPISHRLFLRDLYQTVKSENTLKRAIKALIDKNYLKCQSTTAKYEPPQYQLNIPRIAEELTKLEQLGIPGYQKLIPSKKQGIKKRYHQKLIPSSRSAGYQKLIPSKIDTNRRSIDSEESITEESIKGEEEKHEPLDNSSQNETEGISIEEISGDEEISGEEEKKAPDETPSQSKTFQRQHSQNPTQSKLRLLQPHQGQEPRPLTEKQGEQEKERLREKAWKLAETILRPKKPYTKTWKKRPKNAHALDILLFGESAYSGEDEWYSLDEIALGLRSLNSRYERPNFTWQLLLEVIPNRLPDESPPPAVAVEPQEIRPTPLLQRVEEEERLYAMSAMGERGGGAR